MVVPVQHLRGRSVQEIAGSFEAAVRRNAVAPGAQLPSVRSVAHTLGVSPSTVAAALRDLRRRGLVVTRERRRTLVSSRPPLLTALPAPPIPAGVRDLASGNPDPQLLPRLDRRLARSRFEPPLYGDPAVLPPLVARACQEFAEAGIQVDTVALVSGALDGVERVLETLLAPGDRVVVEDPGYPAVFDLVRAMGMIPLPVMVDDRGLRPDRLVQVLRQGADAVILTPRGQNPTGAALDHARTVQLRHLLRRFPDVLIIEDDHQGAVSGAPGRTVVEKGRRWAVIRSVAKSLGPDLRLAFVAADPETLSRLAGRLALGPGWVSHLLQRLVLDLLLSRMVRLELARAQRRYAERRESLVAALKERSLAASGRSGFNVWIPVPEETAVVSGLLLAGWAVAPGARYRILTPPAIRVTTATLSPGEARRFAADLERVMTGAPGRRAA